MQPCGSAAIFIFLVHTWHPPQLGALMNIVHRSCLRNSSRPQSPSASHAAAADWRFEDCFLRAGSGPAEQGARMRLQGQLLSSDMSAFKAANPLADFQV